MRTMAARRVMAVLTAVATVGLMSLPAGAATVVFSFEGDDFYIPRPVESSDQENVYRLLNSYDLAANGYADLIGLECTFSVTAANGESVHLNNFGAIVTGGNETDIFDTESLPDVLTTQLEDATLVLGETIELYNVMVRDDNGTIGTSVEYVVTVTCTTEEETTTTTVETTTTTTVETTTTTAPTTTTTTLPVSTTSILGTTTTTTVADTTTTSVAATSTSTIPPVTGTPFPSPARRSRLPGSPWRLLRCCCSVEGCCSPPARADCHRVKHLGDGEGWYARRHRGATLVSES
jgi:hypothetical protein